MVVLADSFDPAGSDVALLAPLSDALGSDRVVLRHVLHLPDDRVERLSATVAEEGYQVDVAPDGDVWVWRAGSLSGLQVAQERTRMAGLAQRLGGDALGWQVLVAPDVAAR